jgi:hypothetical protein
MVGLARTFGQVFDLVVLDADLLAQKIVLAFEPLDVSGRDQSRRVGGRCGFLRLLVVALCRCDSCRGMPRLVATSRDRSHLLDVGNVLVHRRGRDEIFFAECGLDAAALKMAFGAIALNAAGRTGEASASIALDGLLDGESEIAVRARRDRSRHVVGHYVYDNAARPTSRRLSPVASYQEEASSLRPLVVTSGVGGSPDEDRKRFRHLETVAIDLSSDMSASADAKHCSRYSLLSPACARGRGGWLHMQQTRGC